MSELHRHVEILYCDDIREETGGKISLMGLYAAELIVTSLPIVLPKLCILIRAVTDASDPFQRLNAAIVRGEERSLLFATGDIELSNIKDETVEAKRSNAKHIKVVQLHIVLSPFQIDAPTILRVQVETERGIIVGGGAALRIMLTQTVNEVDQHTVATAERPQATSKTNKLRNIGSKTVTAKAKRRIRIR